MLLLRRPFGGGDDAGFLSIEIDLGDFAEGEVMGVLGDLVDAEACAGVVEEDVAGDFERVRHRDRAVPLFSPAAETASEEDGAAAAIERCSRTDRAVGKTGHGHHGLEDGSRRVHALDGAVQFDLEWIGDDRPPDVGRESFRVDVRVERRRRDHGQHFAVAWIERDRRADELVLDKILLGAALQLEVDR